MKQFVISDHPVCAFGAAAQPPLLFEEGNT
jgi:hypothetical protein